MPSNRVFNALDLTQAKAMYRFEHVGAVHLCGALNAEFHSLLRNEVLGAAERANMAELLSDGEHFTDIYYGPNLSYHRFGLDSLPLCTELKIGYTELVYNSIADAVGFGKKEAINSFSINMYQKSWGGMDYHADEPEEINLIGVVAVDGDGKFSIMTHAECEDKGEISFVVKPRDMVLLRASADKTCQPDLRPLHRVKVIGDKYRYSIILRQYENRIKDFW